MWLWSVKEDLFVYVSILIVFTNVVFFIITLFFFYSDCTEAVSVTLKRHRVSILQHVQSAAQWFVIYILRHPTTELTEPGCIIWVSHFKTLQF